MIMNIRPLNFICNLDLNGNIPAFFTITKGTVNDVNFLDDVTFEVGAYYVMDKVNCRRQERIPWGTKDI